MAVQGCARDSSHSPLAEEAASVFCFSFLCCTICLLVFGGLRFLFRLILLLTSQNLCLLLITSPLPIFHFHPEVCQLCLQLLQFGWYVICGDGCFEFEFVKQAERLCIVFDWLRRAPLFVLLPSLLFALACGREIKLFAILLFHQHFRTLKHIQVLRFFLLLLHWTFVLHQALAKRNCLLNQSNFFEMGLLIQLVSSGLFGSLTLFSIYPHSLFFQFVHPLL